LITQSSPLIEYIFLSLANTTVNTRKMAYYDLNLQGSKHGERHCAEGADERPVGRLSARELEWIAS
jgi:hypothetical protein